MILESHGVQDHAYEKDAARLHFLRRPGAKQPLWPIDLQVQLLQVEVHQLEAFIIVNVGCILFAAILSDRR